MQYPGENGIYRGKDLTFAVVYEKVQRKGTKYDKQNKKKNYAVCGNICYMRYLSFLCRAFCGKLFQNRDRHRGGTVLFCNCKVGIIGKNNPIPAGG